MTKTKVLIAIIAVTSIIFVLPNTTTPAYALVGDIVQTVDASGFITAFCSIGLSFDGTHLYFDECFDGRIWITDTAPIPTVIDVRDFSAEIPENPNAMAFDAARGVTYVATQFGGLDCEIYEINHQGTFNNLQDDTVSLLFATPVAEVGNCFIDGLAYNQNDPIAGADALYVSGDAQNIMSIYLLDGTLVQTVDTSTIDPGAATTSGLAVGGSNLYLANNGGGDVFRATLPSLTLLDQFVSADERQEDMECDPVTFAPTEVMWLRTTPQGGNFPNVATAFEIEPDTCGLGGEEPEPETGRMTGGGSITATGMRVTHGFELFCDATATPNNIQVNWGKGNKFHLESLTSASCSDDPNISEGKPVAGFDTYIASGIGRYNGVDGATIEFELTDAGEPGKNDFAQIKITDAGSTVVLDVSGNLDRGNHQAHPN